MNPHQRRCFRCKTYFLNPQLVRHCERCRAAIGGVEIRSTADPLTGLHVTLSSSTTAHVPLTWSSLNKPEWK